MSRRALFLLAGLLLLATAARAHDEASREAHKWLDKMAYAVKNLNYEGVFVHAHGNKLETIRIIHRADENGETERLLSLNGVPREIIRNNNSLICILPDSRSVVVEKTRSRKYVPAALIEATTKLEKYYRYMVIGDGRVAGRLTRIVAVVPRDRYRYGYRLWIDKQTGLLLKSDLLNEKGRVLEQVMYTQITIHDRIPAHRLKQTISSDGYKTFRQKSDRDVSPLKKDRSRWTVRNLPAGFMRSMHMKHGMPASKKMVEHIMFSDGLSSVSVFIEKNGAGKASLRGSSRMGAVNAYGITVSGYQVTVVGGVPRATVMMIGQSLRLNPAVK